MSRQGLTEFAASRLPALQKGRRHGDSPPTREKHHNLAPQKALNAQRHAKAQTILEGRCRQTVLGMAKGSISARFHVCQLSDGTKTFKRSKTAEIGRGGRARDAGPTNRSQFATGLLDLRQPVLLTSHMRRGLVRCTVFTRHAAEGCP